MGNSANAWEHLSLVMHRRNKSGVDQPRLRGFGIGADEEDFLHGAGGVVETFEAGVGFVLNFEAGRRLAATDLDSAGDDARHVRTVLDDAIEQRIKPADPAMLTLNPAELHEAMINRKEEGTTDEHRWTRIG